MHKCPAVNGAAFAIKRDIFEKVNGFRKVVAEDIDIATRAFLEDCSFAYSHEVEVENEVHSNWKKWFTQRRRWAIGQALWLKDWYKPLAGSLLKTANCLAQFILLIPLHRRISFKHGYSKRMDVQFIVGFFPVFVDKI